jgi:hypothetical protein
MARPRSDDRRNAIMAAAIRVIASQGLSAATATRRPALAGALFAGMRGMNRVFQGAATVDSILRDLIERAAEAALRSIFVGFETLTPDNLRRSRIWDATTRR